MLSCDVIWSGALSCDVHNIHVSEMWHVKRPVQCEQQESPCNITKYFACHASVSSRLDRKISELLPPNFSSLFFSTIYSTLLLCSSLLYSSLVYTSLHTLLFSILYSSTLLSSWSKLRKSEVSHPNFLWLNHCCCPVCIEFDGYSLSAIQWKLGVLTIQLPFKHLNLNYRMSDLPLLYTSTLSTLPNLMVSLLFIADSMRHARVSAEAGPRNNFKARKVTHLLALRLPDPSGPPRNPGVLDPSGQPWSKYNQSI